MSVFWYWQDHRGAHQSVTQQGEQVGVQFWSQILYLDGSISRNTKFWFKTFHRIGPSLSPPKCQYQKPVSDWRKWADTINLASLVTFTIYIYPCLIFEVTVGIYYKSVRYSLITAPYYVFTTTLSIKTFSIMTLSTKTWFETLTLKHSWH